MVVRPQEALRFGPEFLPRGEALDVVVTLTRSSVSPAAKLVLRADGEVVAELDPPDDRRGTWQSRPVRWVPTGDPTRWSLALESARPGDVVHVRDVGAFSDVDQVQSTVLAR